MVGLRASEDYSPRELTISTIHLRQAVGLQTCLNSNGVHILRGICGPDDNAFSQPELCHEITYLSHINYLMAPTYIFIHSLRRERQTDGRMKGVDDGGHRPLAAGYIKV